MGDLCLALCNAGGELYAIESVCTHDGGPLEAGVLEGYEVECPRHGARFDVRSGEAVCLPAMTPVRAFLLRVRGDAIEVAVGDS